MNGTEVATECVKEVEFGLMTDEEAKKLSVINITNPNMLDTVGRPLPGGLYDPLLGPMNDYTLLVRVVQNTCLICYRFKASQEEVEMCISKLNLIIKGDVSGARELHDDGRVLSNDHEDSDNRGDDVWTSFQLSETLSVLDNFMMKKRTKCSHCDVKSPPITKPTFGLIHMGGWSDDNTKANIIRGHKLDELMDEGDVEGPSNKRRKINDDVLLKYMKWKKPRSLLPTEVRGIVERLWENEAWLCSFIFDIRQLHNTSQKKSAFTLFFLKTILVPPTKFRNASKGVLVTEHPQTVLLGKILDANVSLANAYEQHAEIDVILSRWMNLQQYINVYFNNKRAAGLAQRNKTSGICKMLDKKEGIFRHKMLGKTVNYACRSVISPDPYLATNEIGIPLVFALKLTYPERVTPWNLTKLKDAILNGPEIHPGATHYADKPTLHKPSMIALTVRVLPEERTLRFHYANCEFLMLNLSLLGGCFDSAPSMLADFDGDEINVHFPQDEISRAEAYNIVNADNQYIVPTRGDPKRGLIQDNIVGAVLLTKRDTFLTLEEFNQLICMSGVCSFGVPSLNAKPGQKLSVLDSENVVQAYPPVIIRPKRLWTGKQVITAILNQITTGYLPFTAQKRAKIAREYFGMDESKKNGESLKATDEVSRKFK
uniref:DNA-directed RNA polymerase subunit n=1 Tax=Chenopodium quinoa TaxID=63459 RepID=A0A803LXG4_CHEQI